MTVCLIRTQLPNVENWKLINGNTEIVIKSRGSQGPAAVERFDTKTGVLKDKIMAAAIQEGRPDWLKDLRSRARRAPSRRAVGSPARERAALLRNAHGAPSEPRRSRDNVPLAQTPPDRESLEKVVSRVYKHSHMAKELPAFLQKLLDKFSSSRDFTISFALHAILIGLFGGTVLYRAVQEPPDFEGETGGFVQPNEAAAPPPAQQAPPQETTFNVATSRLQPTRLKLMRSRLRR